MEFDGSFIYILFAIGYFIFKIFFSKDDDKKPKKARPAVPGQPQPTASTPDEPSLEEVLETLFKKPESAPQVKPAAPKPAAQKKVSQQQPVRQKIHSISSKKREDSGPLQLIELDDEEQSPDSSFDVENINWKNAIISKEILDRKYA
jgi:hypothetical protein